MARHFWTRRTILTITVGAALSVSSACSDGSFATSSRYSSHDESYGYPVSGEPQAPLGIGDPNTFAESPAAQWIETAIAPASAFGLDVDTGSFRVAHSMIDDGRVPDPDSVRPEEWINATAESGEGPVDEELSASVELARLDRRPDGVELLRVAVETRRLSDANRPAANVTFVVDTSGSMEGDNRIGLVRKSIGLLAGSLDERDTISIVSYSENAKVRLAPTSAADRGSVEDAVQSLRIDGGTNLEAGLRLGYEQARAAAHGSTNNVVILASDGVANIGDTVPDSLADMVRESAARGTHLVTVGYGLDGFNDHLMEQLANQGDGLFHYVDSVGQAERLFGSDIGSLVTLIARDAKAQVDFDPAVVHQHRLIGYQNRLLSAEEFDDANTDAGELTAGLRVTALYEIQRAKAVLTEAPVGTLRIRWKSAATNESHELSEPIVGASAEPSNALRMAALAADTAELLQHNPLVVERGVTFADLVTEAAALESRNVGGAASLRTVIDGVVALQD